MQPSVGADIFFFGYLIFEVPSNLQWGYRGGVPFGNARPRLGLVIALQAGAGGRQRGVSVRGQLRGQRGPLPHRSLAVIARNITALA